jgi:hypothetical protein
LLTSPEIQTLTQLIFAQLGVNPSVATISVWVGKQAVQDLPAAALVVDVARWIVTTALAEPTPDRLIQVINAADNQEPGFESLKELARRLTADPGAWVPSRRDGPVDWTLDADPLTVPDGLPFLDRLDFRRLLPRVGHELTMPTCVLVRGDSGAGKSYLQDFCKSFAAQRKDFAVGYTKLGSSGLKDFSPRIPPSDLAQGLGTDRSKLPPFHEDQHRDARNLAAWIAFYTPRRPVPSLAILDDFGASELNAAVHTFVLELVRLVQSDEKVAEKLRVLLLGYDPKRLSDENLAYETHILEHVEMTHIDEWFRKRFPGHPEYRYQGAMDELDAKKIPPRGSMRMRTLNTFVHMISGQFQSAGP